MSANLLTTDQAALRGHILDDDLGIIRTPVQWLTAINDPFRTPPWEGVDNLTVHEVRRYLSERRFTHDIHTQRAYDPAQRTACRECEIARIADLAAHGWPHWTEEDHLIEVDLGLGAYMPNWVIIDGNHRLAAAVVRDDTYIDVAAAGEWDRCIAVLVEGRDLWDIA